jgi:type VI secretion system protein ImpC
VADEIKDAQAGAINLQKFLSSMRLSTTLNSTPTPMIQNNLEQTNENVSDEERFLSGLAAVVFNVDREGGRFDKGKIQEVILAIDNMITAQVNEIIHNEKFQKMEAAWRGLQDLVSHTNFRANIMIDMLDVTKEELYEDFENNSVDISKGAFFNKVYIQEYDQFGGKPFGGIVGLFEFEHTPKDEFWLRQMGKVANASHAP